jgi:hypothetical protein
MEKNLETDHGKQRTVEYAPTPPKGRSFSESFWRFFYQLNKPMPLGMYWRIMLVLSVVVTVVALVAVLIAHALHW